MNTKIIITKKLKVVKEYDFLITMSKGDFVEFNKIEYIVSSCFLDIENNVMLILLNV